MFDYVSVLTKNPNGVLATKNGDKLAARVFEFLFAEGNKLYFCTGNNKPVYQQMQKDANVSFCTFPANYDPVVSISGKAVFVDDKELKARILKDTPSLKDIYKTPEDPTFAVFYIDAEEVETFSFTEGTKNYKL